VHMSNLFVRWVSFNLVVRMVDIFGLLRRLAGEATFTQIKQPIATYCSKQ